MSTIRNCRGDCVRDPITGEVWCPVSHGWVDKCPKEEMEADDE